MTGKKIQELKIGDSAQLTKKVTEGDIYSFAGVSGDFNPAHLDQSYAEGTPFKSRVAHGMLTAGYISTVIGTQLPGPGTIYLGQDLKFTNPVYIDDTVTITCTVTDLVEGKNRVVLETIGENQDGDRVVEGQATVLAPR